MKWGKNLINTQQLKTRLVSVDILGKEREPGVGKLGWHGNLDTGFVQNPVCGFLNFFEIAATVY